MAVTEYDLSSFGLLLKGFRKRRHLTQQQLASAVGVHRSAIIRWEQGDFLPQSKTIVLELARHLHLDDQETRELLEVSLTGLAPHWHVPFQRNPFFTGREEILEILHMHLSTNPLVALTQSYALHGLGGVGKTQIALEYAYRYELSYSAVFWIGAETDEQIVVSLLHMATVLQLPEREDKDQQRVVAAVQRWLTSHTQWLLIWDNVEDLALLDRFLPSSRSGTILITTRCQTLGTLAQGLDLSPMEQEEGVVFLLRRAKVLSPGLQAIDEQVRQFATRAPAQYAAAEELVQVMGGLPLALDQAGAYIEESRCGLPGYLELFRTQDAALLKLRGEGSRTHPASVSTTLLLSITATAGRHPAVWDLLRVCALLSPDAMPEELFRQGAEHLGGTLEVISRDQLEWHRLIGSACAYSLLHWHSEEQALSMHRLVQAVLVQTMTPVEQAQWLQRIIKALDSLFPEVLPVTEHTAWKLCERLLTQALLCLDRTGPDEESLALASLAYKVAQYLRARGQYTQAEPLLQHALHIREREQGSEHPDVARVLNYLAILHWSQGKYAEAEPLYQRALSIRECVLGPDHLDVASSLNNLALLYWSQGKYAEAEPLYQRTLSIRERAQGAEHPDVATSLNNLAALYWEQGRYAEAEPLYQRALGILEQVRGPDHALVAQMLNNLALVYQDQGKYAEAEPLYRRALSILEQALGPEHPEVAQTLNNLANLCRERGKYLEAEPLYQRALRISEQSHGPDHPDLATSLGGLANLLRDQGRYAEAEPLYRRTLAFREQHLGQQHPETAQTLHDLALFHQMRGNVSQAGPFAERALQIRSQSLGDAHPRTIASRAFLAQLATERVSVQDGAALPRGEEDRANHNRAVRQREKAILPSQETSSSFSSEDDPLQGFLDSCCELHPLARCSSRDLWQAYTRWANDHQECYPLARGAFIAQLKRHGCRADRTMTARIWRGIALVKPKA